MFSLGALKDYFRKKAKSAVFDIAIHCTYSHVSKPGRTAKHMAALLRKLTTDKKSVVRQTIANFIVCTNESDVAEPAVRLCVMCTKAEFIIVASSECAAIHRRHAQLYRLAIWLANRSI